MAFLTQREAIFCCSHPFLCAYYKARTGRGPAPDHAARLGIARTWNGMLLHLSSEFLPRFCAV